MAEAQPARAPCTHLAAPLGQNPIEIPALWASPDVHSPPGTKPSPENPSIPFTTPSNPFLLSAGIEMQPDVVLTGITTKPEGPAHHLELRAATPARATPVVTRQLLFRRGVAAAAAVAALALGIAIKLITSAA